MALTVEIGEFGGVGGNKIGFEGEELVELGESGVERVEFGLIDDFFGVEMVERII